MKGKNVGRLVSRVLSWRKIAMGNHSSRPTIARRLKRSTRVLASRAGCGPHRWRPHSVGSCSKWGLPKEAVTYPLVGSYPTFSPLPKPCGPGGILSVALSLALRPVDVIDHFARRSPDFPPRSKTFLKALQAERLPSLPTGGIIAETNEKRTLSSPG